MLTQKQKDEREASLGSSDAPIVAGRTPIPHWITFAVDWLCPTKGLDNDSQEE
jgi:hypothetical protein